ncbi:integrase [Halobacteriales archaeon QS_1_67_19]|nr:MAG: integrase [Halobacteriales archaeon QS_1_67_19]
MPELEPITPREALEMYLQDVSGDLSPNSIKAKQYQLGFFVRWCENSTKQNSLRSESSEGQTEPRIENLNNIKGRDFTRFKNWRKEDIGNVTLKTNLSALRTFMDFCVKIDAVQPNIPDKINVPSLDQGENRRESMMDAERAETILTYLGKFEYASFDHVLFLLQWTTGMRMSAIHSLDIDDFHSDDAKLEVRHRPEQGTRLKNGPDGERFVTVSEDVVATIDDYIEYNRIDTTDEYGREPLFSTRYGRMHKNQLNKHIYSVTRPCNVGLDCPSGKKPETCEYTGSYDSNLKCPHNTRPHDIRRGSITSFLRDDVPKVAVSDRMNVAVKTLDNHYDQRSEDEKAEMRRDYFSD